jgi:hypothetical protein
MFIRPAQTANSPLIISEFRLRGPGGPADEFIEIYNNTDEAHVVTASDGSSGYGVFASDGIMRFFIPNGTVILTRLAQRVWQTRYGQVQILRGDRKRCRSVIQVRHVFREVRSPRRQRRVINRRRKIQRISRS